MRDTIHSTVLYITIVVSSHLASLYTDTFPTIQAHLRARENALGLSSQNKDTEEMHIP
jgi:hypothetical protein